MPFSSFELSPFTSAVIFFSPGPDCWCRLLNNLTRRNNIKCYSSESNLLCCDVLKTSNSAQTTLRHNKVRRLCCTQPPEFCRRSFLIKQKLNSLCGCARFNTYMTHFLLCRGKKRGHVETNMKDTAELVAAAEFHKLQADHKRMNGVCLQRCLLSDLQAALNQKLHWRK